MCIYVHFVDVDELISLSEHIWRNVALQWGKIIWSPADFVRLPTDKEMISL